MKYDIIIWDFNGTIIDDVDLGISSVNTMLAKRGLLTIANADDYREKMKFPIIDYYRDLGFDFDAEPYEALAHEWVALYREGENTCPPCFGAVEAIHTLADAGARQMILSASEREMLVTSLRRLGLESCFLKITAQDNVYAEGKLGTARRLAEEICGMRAVMIGDTAHDFESAQIMDADCILFTGGHGKRSELAACDAILVDDLREAAAIILGE